MAQGGSQAPMVDEFEIFRAQAMGCRSPIEVTFDDDSSETRQYTPEPEDWPSPNHARDNHVHSDSSQRRKQSRKRTKRDYISDREIESVTGGDSEVVLPVEDTFGRENTRNNGRPKSVLTNISSNHLSQDDSYHSASSPHVSGMQRSHSCRIRRSPRLSSPQREVKPTVRTSHVDNEGNTESKLSRQRNKTLPARRHMQQKSQLLASPVSLDPHRRSYHDINEADSDECRIYRVRSFTTTNSGIVNRGDSFKIRRKGSGRGSSKAPKQPSSRRSSQASIHRGSIPCTDENIALLSAIVPTDQSTNRFQDANGNAHTNRGSLKLPENIPSISIETSSNHDTASHVDINDVAMEADCMNGNGDASDDSDEDGGDEVAQIYRVLVLGSQEVGKTTLAQQLMTSEYLANKEFPPDDENGEKIVSVLLDDEESMVQFVDTPRQEVIDWEENVDAFIIVYSVTDRSSFCYAQACLQDLRMRKKGQRACAVILVGNKQDSVRNRTVSEHDGKNLATKRNCKFIEVSALLDHKVDELLVGIIRQIRLKQRLSDDDESKKHSFPTGCLQRAAFGMFRKIFKRNNNLSKSCDNLMV